LANTAQSRKRARQNEDRRARNTGRKSMMRTHIKHVRAAISAGDKDKANAEFKTTVSILDRLAGQGLIPRNTAARWKSRMNAAIVAI